MKKYTIVYFDHRCGERIDLVTVEASDSESMDEVFEKNNIPKNQIAYILCVKDNEICVLTNW